MGPILLPGHTYIVAGSITDSTDGTAVYGCGDPTCGHGIMCSHGMGLRMTSPLFGTADISTNVGILAVKKNFLGTAVHVNLDSFLLIEEQGRGLIKSPYCVAVAVPSTLTAKGVDFVRDATISFPRKQKDRTKEYNIDAVYIDDNVPDIAVLFFKWAPPADKYVGTEPNGALLQICVPPHDGGTVTLFTSTTEHNPDKRTPKVVEGHVSDVGKSKVYINSRCGSVLSHTSEWDESSDFTAEFETDTGTVPGGGAVFFSIHNKVPWLVGMCVDGKRVVGMSRLMYALDRGCEKMGIKTSISS